MAEVRPFLMSVKTMLELHSKTFWHNDDGAEMYRSFASDLIAEGFNVIYLIEKDGKPSQAILIDIENINVLEHIQSSRVAPSSWR